jgi:hypothetical protein
MKQTILDQRTEVEFLVDQSTGFGDFEIGNTVKLKTEVAETLESRGIVKILTPKKKVKDGQ